ncbi:MAG: XRE family transcriptional regulator [Oscillatoriales cyanobacterium]|nr:MAG: XRE family transcriptional regulator [Oscillatoriales cyanobacterium]
MSALSNNAVVDNRQELRPVRFTETGRMRLGKMLKAARQTKGWSVSEDVGISAATVNRYERGKLDNLDWRSLSLLCFVLKPIDPVTNQPLEPANALYIACEHSPYNDAKLYEEITDC